MIEVTPYISPCRKGEDPTSKKLHLRVSKPSTDTPEDVVKGLEHSTTATAADIRAVLSGLRDYILNALSQGRSVQLEGLGRISAIPHFTKAVLPNEKFRNADIETKAVQFLPEREFLKAVRHQTRYHAGPMHMAKDTTVDDALQFCKEWLAGHDVLIAADLMRELQIGRSRASRLLRELVRRSELVGKKYGAVVQYKAPLNPPASLRLRHLSQPPSGYRHLPPLGAESADAGKGFALRARGLSKRVEKSFRSFRV